MSETVIIGGLVTAILGLCVYVRYLHSQQVKHLKESAKEHSERTVTTTEAMIGVKSSVDTLVKVSEKLCDKLDNVVVNR